MTIVAAPPIGTPGALEARFAGLDAAALVERLCRAFRGRVAVVSSFGADSAVLLSLVAAADPAVPVLFLDTGMLFPETLEHRDRLVERLGLRDVRTLRPDPAGLRARDPSDQLWHFDPDACCVLRKVRPLERALAGFDLSLNGRRRGQAATRGALPRFEPDGPRIKANPLADWDAARVAAHLAASGLPPHPLVAEGYPSIGCGPCTTRVAPGEDPRAGRWRGTAKTECGIHRPLPDPTT